MSLRVAIIGCGDIAGGYDERRRDDGIFSHAGAYRSEDDIEIVSAFDIDQERLNSFCHVWSIPRPCHELREMLGGSYDIVSVCTPDNTHRLIMEDLIEAGCTRNIWVEKPFATSAKDAKSVIDAARARRVGLWLNNQRRWEPGHMRAQEYIAEGSIGQIVHVNAYYVKGVTHIGCTAVDTVRFLCGEVSWVAAYPPFAGGDYGEDPSLRSILGTQNGGTVNMVGCDMSGYTFSIFELDIIGTLGRVRVEQNGDVISFSTAQEYGHYPGFKELRVMERFETEMKWSMKYGIELIRKNIDNDVCSSEYAEEGYKDLLVTDAIVQSAAQNGTRIELVHETDSPKDILPDHNTN